ncbi:MAG: SH3 domain-containing protein, partial [Muribaculaceae bacterium]|nr:SH3 domain-containing protein [Muribaculaceae bacterium]
MKLKFILITLLLLPCMGIAQSQKVKRIMTEVEKKVAPDKRQIVYDIMAKEKNNDVLFLSGKTSEASALDALTNALKANHIRYRNNVTVFGNDKWALPRISVANLRTKPGHGSEMASQALMGTPVRLLEQDGDWWRVQTPDGYIAWVIDNSLAMKTPEEMQKWRSADRVVVTSTYQTRCYNS